MKFRGGNFFRQFGDCCMFIEIDSIISDDGQTAELVVTWNRQLSHGWKPVSKENIRVRESDYKKWTHHFPRGDKITHAS